MEEEAHREIKISIIWRGKTLELVEKAGSTIGELGIKLKELTDVAPDTMRLLLPRSRRSAPVSLLPFSDAHSKLSLAETGIAEGRSIRMMGVFLREVEEVSQPVMKSDQRIAGFIEEERRAKQRISNRHDMPRRLPQGPYVFCDFRALQLPGIELNPPAEKALAIMHRLASDQGIIAIMKKHRWRVGIMTELAPVGYVGISPKCILGFNKNHGEEISLRLRTDDLKGFRKFESIKKTLLHELAHMLHSEHDANFLALDKQLNQEAIALDWTKSKSHTLSGLRQEGDVDEFFSSHQTYSINKLGGNPLHSVVDARASAAAAALSRLENSPSLYITSNLAQDGVKRNTIHVNGSSALSQTEDEPDPDDCSRGRVNKKITNATYTSMDLEQDFSEPDPDDREPDPDERSLHGFMSQKPDVDEKMWEEPDPDDCQEGHNIGRPKTIVEPDPDDSHEGHNIGRHKMIAEPDPDDSQEGHAVGGYQNFAEPDPDKSQEGHAVGRRYEINPEPDPEDCQEGGNKGRPKSIAEPHPDDSQESHNFGRYKTITEPDPDDSQEGHTIGGYKTIVEPDPDDSQEGHAVRRHKTIAEPDPDDSQERHAIGRYKTIADPDDSQEGHAIGIYKTIAEPDPDDSQGHTVDRYKIVAEPDPDDCHDNVGRAKTMAEIDPNNCQENKTMAEPGPDDSLLEQPDTVDALSRRSSDIHIVGSSYVGSNLDGNSVTEMPHGTLGSRLNKPVISDFESLQLSLEHEDADLRRIQESTAATSVRLHDAIQKLKSQVPSVEIAPVIRTLFTILRNVMDHPNETKFRRLRKANPIFQRSIAKYEAALEVLRAVGFSEDSASNETGIAETCIVLKRNDPGLLWLARSSLEVCNA